MYIAWSEKNILTPKFYVFLSEEDCLKGMDELGLEDLTIKEIQPYNVHRLSPYLIIGVKQVNYDNEHGEITPYHIVGPSELSYLATRKVTSWFLERRILKEGCIVYYTNPSCKSRAKRMS